MELMTGYTGYHLTWYDTNYMEQIQRLSGVSPQVATGFSIKGIEVFSELSKVTIVGFEHANGNLKDNKKLKSVCLSMTSHNTPEDFNYVKAFKNMVPVKQMVDLNLEIKVKDSISKFSFAEAKKLKRLELWRTSYADEKAFYIKQFDVSKNKNLRYLKLDNVAIGTKLDLTNQVKLKEIVVTGGESACDYKFRNKDYTHSNDTYKEIGENYQVNNKYSVKMILAKNNAVEKIVWFTKSRSLDLSNCKKLKQLQVPMKTKVKFGRKWFEKKGKKQVAFTFNGTKVKKYSLQKNKKYVYVTKKLSETVKPHVSTYRLKDEEWLDEWRK